MSFDQIMRLDNFNSRRARPAKETFRNGIVHEDDHVSDSDSGSTNSDEHTAVDELDCYELGDFDERGKFDPEKAEARLRRLRPKAERRHGGWGFVWSVIVTIASLTAMILIDVTRISAEREPTYITTLPALRVSLDLSLQPGIQHIDTQHIDIQHLHTMQDIYHILHRVANQSGGHVTDFNTKSASDASMWQIRMQEVVDADARARSSESFGGRILRDLDWAGVPYMRPLWSGGQAMTAVDHATATYRQHLFDDGTKEMERRYTELSQGLGLGVGVAKGVRDGALVLAEKTMGSEGRDLVRTCRDAANMLMNSFENAANQAEADGQRWLRTAKELRRSNSAAIMVKGHWT